MIRALALLLLLAAPAAAQSPLCLCLRCLTGTHLNFWMPSGSMKPLLEPGACVEVRRWTDPAAIPPGRVVAFTHPVTAEAHLARLIATAGQTVQMVGGRPVIDGTPVRTRPAPDYLETMALQGPAGALPRCPGPTAPGATCAIARHVETLGGHSWEVLDLGPSPLDDMDPLTVPPDHAFLLGDHRDNVLDSRVPRTDGGPGMVPLTAILGTLDPP